MWLDPDLEDIIKIAFAANSTQTDYHFRRYLQKLYKEKQATEKKLNSISQFDFGYDTYEEMHLQSTIEKMEIEIRRLETLLTSCRLK